MRIVLEKPRNAMHWLQIHGLYLTAFPSPERKPFSRIRNMHRKGRTDVWRILRDGRFAGFAATVNGEDLILLDYLAVRGSCRGAGVGSAAMGLLLEQYADKGLFVEIESTREECRDLARRQQRKRFYLAAGMEEMNVYVNVFEVRMELLGTRCRLDFDGYRNFYHDYYSPWAASHLEPME